MPILHVVAGMNPEAGGVSQAILTLVSEMTKSGQSSEIVSLDSPDAEFLKTLNVPISALGPARGAWSYSSHLIPWLHANVSRFSAVIVHGLWLSHSYSVRKVLSHHSQENHRGEGRIPWFVMPHGMLDPYFQRDRSRKWKAIRNAAYWRLIERAVVNEADGLLFTCKQERDLAKTTFPGYTPKREAVVGLGIEAPPAYGDRTRQTEMINSFRSNHLRATPNRPYLLFLGRLDPKKGVDIAIRSYAKEARRAMASGKPIPGLVVAGPVHSDYAKQMIEIVRDMEKSGETGSFEDSKKPAILFTGMLRGDEKWGALFGSEAFILPSHQENFGIAVVEALACGLPVLISKEVNIWQEIAEAGAGWFESDTDEGMEKCIRAFLESPAERLEEMSNAAAGCFENYFTARAATQGLLNFIHGFSNKKNRVQGSAIPNLFTI